MNDLHEKVAGLGDLIQRDIPDQQADAMLARIHERRQRQQLTQAVISAALIFGMAGYLAHGLMADSPMQAERTWPSVVRLGDGTTAVPLSSDTNMKLVSENPKQVVIALNKGRGRFEVTPSETREVRVVVEEVTVRVVGTAFEVSRATDTVDVSVMRGKVEVTGPSGQRILTAGQSGTFASKAPRNVVQPTTPQDDMIQAPDAAQAVPVAADTAAEAESPKPQTAAPKGVVAKKANTQRPIAKKAAAPDDASSRWKALAEKGDYGAAHAALKEETARVANTAKELLFAADVARRSGHPRAAVPYLEQVVDRFGSDRRAPMAAFSLGRIHLYQLGKPAAAARRFAQAQSLDPKGTLAEDALAREAEAWSRAGNADRAKAAALRYLKSYPKGHRLDAIKRFGGIE